MCNSDGHKAAPAPKAPAPASSASRAASPASSPKAKPAKAIFAALKSRRCYGTTGARIDLDFSCNDHPMGSVIAPPSPARPGQRFHFTAAVRGTAPIESLELFQLKQVIQTLRPKSFNNLTRSNRIRVSWRGSRIRGRARRVNWDGTIRAQGPRILDAQSHFDTPIDRITRATDHEIDFISQTTGDTDWIDLVLSDATAGTLHFDSKAGHCHLDLRQLTDDHPRQTFPFGGLDMSVTIERYPENPTDSVLSLEADIEPPPARAPATTTPYSVKVTQVDGQMAWSSPIYLRTGV
jgi:hypothetical protein